MKGEALVIEPVDEQPSDVREHETESGRIVVSARVISRWLAIYAISLGAIALLRHWGIEDLDPGFAVTMCGLVIVWDSDSWSASSRRHRVALAAGALFALFGPLLAVLPLSHRDVHGWYPAVPLELAASFAAVAIYVAITRLPGFAPPPPVLDEDDSEGFVPGRLWTADERRQLMADRPQLIFRYHRPMVFHLLVFGTLALFAFVLADAGFVTEVWFGGLAATVACVLSVRCAVRALAIAVIVSPERLTVRNVLRTHRIPWTEVRAIVPPDEDPFLRLRIKRIGKHGIGCTAVTESVFRRSRRTRDIVRELTELCGPRSAVEAGQQ